MDNKAAGEIMEALSKRPRIIIFRLLVGSPSGIALRELPELLGVRKNHVWVHLKALSEVGLVSFQDRIYIITK